MAGGISSTHTDRVSSTSTSDCTAADTWQASEILLPFAASLTLRMKATKLLTVSDVRNLRASGVSGFKIL